MKATITVLAVTLLLFGCKKEEQSLSERMIGKWQLTNVINDVGGRASTNPSNYIEFTGSHFSNYRQGYLMDSGTYRLIETPVMSPKLYYEVLFISGADTIYQPTFMSMEGSKLELIVSQRETWIHTKVR